MEQAVLDGNAPQVAPTAAPVAAPNVEAAAMPQQNFQAPPSGMSFKSFLSTMNLVEVGFGVLGAWALFSTIYYYRNKLQIDKLMTNKLQKQIDEINITLQDEINNKQQMASYDGINGSFYR